MTIEKSTNNTVTENRYHTNVYSFTYTYNV